MSKKTKTCSTEFCDDDPVANGLCGACNQFDRYHINAGHGLAYFRDREYYAKRTASRYHARARARNRGLRAVVTILVLLTALGTGCTDARIGKMTALGKAARVTCWSGGIEIYEGCSTGKVVSEQSSDGYFFKDQTDGRFKEVSGNCVIDYNAPCPERRDAVRSEPPTVPPTTSRPEARG